MKKKILIIIALSMLLMFTYGLFLYDTSKTVSINNEKVPLSSSTNYQSYSHDSFHSYDIDSIPSSIQLHIEGNKILNNNGNIVKLNGPVTSGFALATNNWYDSNWYTWYNNDSLQTIKSWGCNAFRVAMTVDTFKKNINCLDTYYHFVDLSISNGLYTIIEWGYTNNPNKEIESAKIFFETLSYKYANNPYIIYEICNEPFNASWAEIKSYAETIIPIIRKNSPNAIVLVGTPYQTSKESDSPLSVLSSPLTYNNLAYVFHNYAGQNLTYKEFSTIDSFLNANLAVVYSEIGTTLANGTDGHYEVPSQTLLNFADSRNLSWFFFNMSDITFNSNKSIAYDSSLVKPGMWNNNLSDDILSDSGRFIKKYLTSNAKNTVYCMMRDYDENYGFWNNTYRSNISSINFCDSLYNPSNVLASWDISMINGTKLVMAYYCLDNNKYTLQIVPKYGEIYAPIEFNKWFSNFSSLESVNFSNLNLSYVRNMRSLFLNDINITEINFTNKKMENLVDMSCTFANCTKLESISFENCNLSSISSMIMSFRNCNNLLKLNMNSFNINTLTSTTQAFYSDNNKKQIYTTIYVDNNITKEFLEKTFNDNKLVISLK